MSARARAWCHSCGSPRFPCGPVPPGPPLARGCWGSGPTSCFLDVSPRSGSCRSGAPGVGFLQPRRWLFICGPGGPWPILGRVGQSPGPCVTLALEAPTSVLGGLAGPRQDPWPPASPGDLPWACRTGRAAPEELSSGPRVCPVTPLLPGQHPHRTIVSGPGAEWEQGVCCGDPHLCARQNRLPVSAQLCQVTRRLRGRAGIVTGDLLGDCSQRRAAGPRESSLLVPTRPRTLRGSHGGDARPCPAGQAGQPWAPRPCDLNAASDGDPGGCPPRPSRVTHAGGAWCREGCVPPTGHRAAGRAWSP